MITKILKNSKEIGFIRNCEIFTFDESGNARKNDEMKAILLDLLPEGDDFKMLKKQKNITNDFELFRHLNNVIGDFSFNENSSFERSTYKCNEKHFNPLKDFPHISHLEVNFNKECLDDEFKNNTKFNQNFSLSGAQHKFQVYIKNSTIFEGYGDFIFKPNSSRFNNLAMNEHFHTTFMKHFGFEAPFNAVISACGNMHYFIKRFDKNKSVISLNALMGALPDDKYNGSFESICEFLANRLNESEKIKFLKYIFANILLCNADLHKKNISFFVDENTLRLTPAYDIINIYAISGMKEPVQCVLSVNGRIRNIRFKDFKKAIKFLGLDYEKALNELKSIAKIYFENYIYEIELFDNSSLRNYLKEANKFFNKIYLTYKQNERLYKDEIE